MDCFRLLVVALCTFAIGVSVRADLPESKNKPLPTDLYGDPLPEGAVARLGTLRFRQHHICGTMAWSPDSRMLASGGEDNTIRLWEAVTGKEVRRFAGHDRGIWSLAWSPDGKTLASASWDNTIRLWEAASGKEVQRFAGHEGGARCLAWSPDGKRLVSGGMDTTLLIWAVRHHPDELPLCLGPSQLQSCWTALAGRDAARAYQAIGTLSRAGTDSVPFLAERLKPVAPVDPLRVSRLIADLDNDQFAVRQKATRELEQLAELAEPQTRRALTRNPSLESRKRLEQLLADLDGWSGERLRALRAITVLENIATVEARQVLRSLATGAPQARLTQEAKASLARLAKR